MEAVDTDAPEHVAPQPIPTTSGLFTADPAVLDIQPGSGINYVDYWWSTNHDGHLVLWHRRGELYGLANPTREIQEHVHPNHPVRYIPRVFVPHRITPGLLTPLT
ncbi:hypothetical protein [Nocardia suismassiliense]|uniref:hypothetical protein n=1 Tax=Nocardia suismassiliense TaxID=2077092 RepID=UPI000D1F1BE0|nr:hypothetical protein [Nocardia suismassiliense]